MSTITFAEAARIVVGIEGRYSNQSTDPGGETKWGIARAKHPEISDAAWAAFSVNDALALLDAGYWTPHRCGEMPRNWALGVFDGEVNQGSVVTMAQTALRVKVDGVVGPGTIRAMQTCDAEAFPLFMARRAVSYARDKTFNIDGLGWLKRLFIITDKGRDPFI